MTDLDDARYDNGKEDIEALARPSQATLPATTRFLFRTSIATMMLATVRLRLRRSRWRTRRLLSLWFLPTAAH